MFKKPKINEKEAGVLKKSDANCLHCRDPWLSSPECPLFLLSNCFYFELADSVPSYLLLRKHLRVRLLEKDSSWPLEQCDHTLKYKVAQNLTKVAQKSNHINIHMKNDCSKTGPKSQYTFGLLLKENSSLGLGEGQMVKVLAFPPMIRVQIPLTPTVFL